MQQSIEAIIFDIGGVLVRTTDWSGRRRWEQQLGLQEFELSTLVFSSPEAAAACIGAGADEAIWRQLADRLNLNQKQLDSLRSDFWSGDTVNAEMLAFIRGIRKHHRTAILSNAWPEMRDLNEQRFGLRGIVDVTTYSFEIRIQKPAPAAYLAVLQQLGIRSEAALFVDDSEINVRGASALGIHTVHFTETDEAIRKISHYPGISAAD